MVRFAKDCMVRLSQITNDLIDTLGEDTAQLKMRVGLHSGETTAGVLRGEKGRFQLFGDTGKNCTVQLVAACFLTCLTL